MIIDFDEYFKNYVYEPIDLCVCYEPIVEPPTDFIKYCQEPENPFSCTVTREISGTWYVVETECDGNEPLPNMVRRLIFSEKGAIS